MKAPLICAVLTLTALPASAHDWYYGKIDPVTGGSCCTSSPMSQSGDCAPLKIEAGMIVAEADGYRLRLTAEQAKQINPQRREAVDTLIPWDRIQPSLDGNYHVCIPRYKSPALTRDFYCFFEPPGT